MTRFPLADLYFSYADEPPRLCLELSGLSEDEIGVLLEALRGRFEDREPGAFAFSIKTSAEYTPLERVKRQRGGAWADSGTRAGVGLILALGINDGADLDDEGRRWLDIYNAAHAMSAEIHQLRRELSHGPVKSSVLSIISREELLDHLAGVNYAPPKPPAARNHRSEPQPRPDTAGATSAATERARSMDSRDGEDEASEPALTASQSRVLAAMAAFDGSRLLTTKAIEEAMDAGTQLSERTIGPTLRELIKYGLAERPQGERRGARLTLRGRRLASKIAN